MRICVGRLDETGYQLSRYIGDGVFVVYGGVPHDIVY